MLWFLLRDDPNIAGWQSGFTDGGRQAGVSAYSACPQ